jgi:hypothetical protein
MDSEPSKAKCALALGIVSLLAGGACFFWMSATHEYLSLLALAGFVCGIVALISGRSARKSIRAGTIPESDLPHAYWGQMLGGFGLVAALFSFVLGPEAGSGVRARAAKTIADMRTLSIVLEAYEADHKTYPPAVDASGQPIFAKNGEMSAGFMPWVVTTPVAYMTELPLDGFTATNRKDFQPFRYATDGTTSWIVASNGPDEKADVDVSAFPAKEVSAGSPEIVLTRFRNLFYDPSNGLISPGDIVWTDRGYAR